MTFVIEAPTSERSAAGFTAWRGGKRESVHLNDKGKMRLRVILRDLVNASLGFEYLTVKTNRLIKSLHSLLWENGKI